MFGIVDRLLFRPPAYMTETERTHHIYFGRNVDGKDFVGNSAQYQRLLDLCRVDVEASAEHSLTPAANVVAHCCSGVQVREVRQRIRGRLLRGGQNVGT
jgi:hypothetical protein